MRHSSFSHRLSHSIVAGLLRAACVFATPAILFTTLATPDARAQEIAPVKQYWVVPQTEDVKLRCHHGNLWYPITSVGTTTALLVDGEIDGWLRVTYPAGTPVVVRSTEAELSPDRTMVKLTRKPRLRAFNKENQFLEECYKSVVLDDVPNPGTELRYLQSVKTRAGEVGGYLVEAPAGSKGFVLATDVRRATPEEIQRAATPVPAPSNPPAPQTATAPETTPAPVTAQPQPADTVTAAPPVTTQPEPAPAPVTVQPQPQVVTPPPVETVQPRPAEPTTTFSPPTTTTPPDNTIEMTRPAQPAPTDILVPVDQPAQPATNDIDPSVTPAPVAPANAVVNTAPRGPMTLEELDRAFDALNAEPIDSAEFQPLITEYQRFLGTLPDDRSNKRMRAYVEARIQILQMKQGVQKSNSELALIRSQATNVDAEARASAERIERTRDYLVVGRLQPSTVYDGKRLPLLYRVQAAEGGRTLAYVAPEPSSLGLDSKLGMIVGVKGKGSLDPSARVTIVQATAVDILQTGADGSYVPVNPAPVDTSYTAPNPTYTPPSATLPPAPAMNQPAPAPPAQPVSTPSGPMLPPRRAPDYGGK